MSYDVLDPKRPEPETAKDLFAHYSEYNKVVRAWFVTFGIGGPTLFLLNSEIARRLTESRMLTWVTILFLIGCALQIFNAVLNKFCALNEYSGVAYPEKTLTRSYKILARVNRMNWIDVVCDVVCFIVFAVAVIIVLPIFVDTSGVASACDVARLRYGGECR